MATKKYINLSNLSVFLDGLKTKFATLTHTHSISEITDYTVDNALSDTSTNPVQNSVIKAELDANLATAKSYTDTKTSNLASISSVNTSISTHNTSTSAHNDIRALISDLTTKLNNFLDVDDTTTDQLSEVITLINNNKGTLESLTTSKVNVSDIVNNLTTSSTSKVLSAAQGVAIKSLIDTLQSEVDGKADSSHTHAISNVTNLQSTLDAKVPTTRTVNGKALTANITLSASDVGADASGSASSALSSANTYTDNAVSQKSQVQIITWEADD